MNASGLSPGKVVTAVKPGHQGYPERIPNGDTCHFPRPNRVPAKCAAE